MKKRILIVEDDVTIATLLSDNLADEGFEVRCVADGDVAVGALRTFAPDLVLLDLMLPGVDGFELCRLWRERHVPLIVVSARSETPDKVKALRLGADDYITKPFALAELMARIHAVLRRLQPAQNKLVLGPITIDLVKMQASKDSRPIELAHRDYELLKYLAERPWRIVYRHELTKEIWGFLEPPNSRALDHAIGRLRKKIEPDPSHPKFICTVYGDGYYLAVPGSDADARRR
jgi:DNA-binding response OmpR family regulator